MSANDPQSEQYAAFPMLTVRTVSDRESDALETIIDEARAVCQLTAEVGWPTLASLQFLTIALNKLDDLRSSHD